MNNVTPSDVTWYGVPMLNDLLLAVAAATPPAGGAATGEIAIATVSATIVTTGLLWLGAGHRKGTVGILQALSDLANRISGQPGWSALPSVIAAVSLLTAVFGMYWDIALHIDVGRDEGPLANPAHYFILVGLYGIFTAGFVAMVLPKERPSPSAIKLGHDWYAPLGGVMICACGAFALLGFPLDDMWHRLFGQDVTLWGPTHLMLIGGASMTLVGIATLQMEGRRVQRLAGTPDTELPWIRKLRLIALTGGLLLGMSTFQAEFDFGVGQFRLVLQPMMIMLAAGLVLVAARLWLGRGVALGTVGLAAEWGFTAIWMPLEWNEAMLPEAVLLGFGMAVAGSLLGAWIGVHLDAERLPRTPSLRGAAVVAASFIAASVVWALYTPAHSGVSATVTTRDIVSGPDRTVAATVRLDPPDAADDAAWFTATAWQGDGFVVDDLERVSRGVYRTTEPLPVHGNWKSMIRLHYGNAVDAIPVFMPRDDAIPAAEVPAERRFTRDFVPDSVILQREQKTTSGWLTTAAYAVVASIALALLALLAWGLHRLAITAPGSRTPSRPDTTHPGRPASPPRPVAATH